MKRRSVNNVISHRQCRCMTMRKQNKNQCQPGVQLRVTIKLLSVSCCVCPLWLLCDAMKVYDIDKKN